MGMDDRENVALIGGGHTFGKCHGAGTEGPGPTPKECPNNPYPGLHGTGKGNDAVTSFLEGAWTSNPTKWDNSYFKNLLDYEWEKHKGPGGKWQWRVKGGKGPKTPMAHGKGEQDIMMLTTDVALAVDPEYRKYVEEFANDEKAYADAFAKVWYKLVNRDMGPVDRLMGPDVAPAQDWQNPLPPPPAKLADMSAVEKELEQVLKEHPEKTSEFVRLARNSANTYRYTDYLGGSNGARIRFSPGKDWKINEGLDKTLDALTPVKEKFGEGLSWADLIVLSGNVACKALGAPTSLMFCPGRTDDTSGEAWETLAYMNAELPTTVYDVEDRVALRGLSKKEFVALAFPSYPSVEQLKEMLLTKTDDEDIWTQTLKYHPVFKRQVEYYIGAGNDTYKKEFAEAWMKFTNADRFDGPIHRACPNTK
jgi:catalase (peroxidase I)